MSTPQRKQSIAVQIVAAGLALCALATTAGAQIVNPADKQLPPPASNPQGEPSYSERLRTWELPATVVEGQAPALLREDELIGDYNQPRWSADRRFPSTRIYVISAGTVELGDDHVVEERGSVATDWDQAALGGDAAATSPARLGSPSGTRAARVSRCAT